jgi:hypothetical protein
MTSVWVVSDASSSLEAIAAVVEKAAGKGGAVTQLF